MNRLSTQTSPYLLQHAGNPVDWEPWDERALDRARALDRPLLVSIGYAACHWCHVMERESFEDPETAAVMNENFVCIKVDREERPDVDAIYMDAVQAMTGHGGWPLTAFCAPDGAPFYTGTYFPNRDRPPIPSFMRVLRAIADAWRDDREGLLAQGAKVVSAIGEASSLRAADEALTDLALTAARAAAAKSFDTRWGGFGGAPKFPAPMTIDLLLRFASRGDPETESMAVRTLDAMAAGGIYDQLGGGFARYAVDERWHVPHFEKMLYDNAQLARAYVDAWRLTGEARFAGIVRETLGYLLREMRHPDGGFFSSQDADSEGVEGKFFTWTWDELLGHVSEAVATTLGALPGGNWGEAEQPGANVLWRPFRLSEVAERAGMDTAELERDLAAGRAALFEARGARVRPATDDKVLAGWNGLAIGAFAEAGRAFGDATYLPAARDAAGFVLERLRRDDGRLLRSWRDGGASIPAFAEDHALLVDGLLSLYEATGETRWFAAARELAGALIELFLDAERGGFFSSGNDVPALVVRPKDLVDSAVPSGNSAAAAALLRLASFTGEAHEEDAALGALRLIRPQLERAPLGFARAVSALDRHLAPSQEVAIVGARDRDDTRALVAIASEGYAPNRALAVAREGDADAANVVPLLRDRVMREGRATAYVCERFVCSLPVTEPEDLRAQLRMPHR